MKSFLSAVALLSSVVASVPAQALTLFSQDFSSSLQSNESVSGQFGLYNGTVGHAGWYEHNSYSYYQLALDLTGSQNAKLKFDYTASLEGWWDGFNVIDGSGNLLWATSGLVYSDNAQFGKALSGWASAGAALFDLSSYDDELLTLRFQFRSDWSVRSTGVNIDNLLVSDDRTAVPEPAALGILGLGILGIAASRRRKA